MTPALPCVFPKTILGAEATDNGRILVVIQLDGGNDGINTVVPFKDEGYAKHRQELRLPEADLIRLTDDLAFQSRLRSASELFQDGRLSVIHGVGYPNPNRSHFESMAIWHSARLSSKEHSGDGWIGNAFSTGAFTQGPHAIHVGTEDLPVALRGRRCTAATISNPSDLRLTIADLAGEQLAEPQTDANENDLADFLTRAVGQAYVSAKELEEASNGADASTRYPSSTLAGRLKLVGQMIKSDAAARVYYTSQGGYDTHAVQLPSHGNLLGELSSSLKAFMDDMRASGLEDRVLVMAFSEFGRRVQENDSIGTDHGTAGPVILAGTLLRPGFIGEKPSLMDLDQGDLKYTIDFRDVYATILEQWLELKVPTELASFGKLDLLRT